MNSGGKFKKRSSFARPIIKHSHPEWIISANLIEQQIEKLDTTIKRYIKEFDRRLGMAGFILHDFEKFKY
jgi:CRISPR type I-D-associated protein Csc3/Cas10d